MSLVLHLRRAAVALSDARASLAEYASSGELGPLGAQLAAEVNAAQTAVIRAGSALREWQRAQIREQLDQMEQRRRRAESRA